jgi:hypothetical protein
LTRSPVQRYGCEQKKGGLKFLYILYIMAAKETVIVVHGTFAAPVEGKPAWYAPGGAFCRQLDERLAAHGSQARCWAHLDECGEELRRRAGRTTTYFSWSGRNSWLDRSAAAQQLLDELDYLIDRGWKWNVVAHSHGGNTVLEAFDLDNPDRIGGLTGNCVLLGTPILRFASPTRKWFEFVERIRVATSPSVHIWGAGRTMPGREPSLFRISVGLILSALLWALLFHYFVNLSGLAPSAVVFESIRFWLVAGGAIAGLAALIWYLRHLAVESATIMTDFRPSARWSCPIRRACSSSIANVTRHTDFLPAYGRRRRGRNCSKREAR